MSRSKSYLSVIIQRSLRERENEVSLSCEIISILTDQGAFSRQILSILKVRNQSKGAKTGMKGISFLALMSYVMTKTKLLYRTAIVMFIKATTNSFCQLHCYKHNCCLDHVHQQHFLNEGIATFSYCMEVVGGNGQQIYTGDKDSYTE